MPKTRRELQNEYEDFHRGRDKTDDELRAEVQFEAEKFYSCEEVQAMIDDVKWNYGDNTKGEGV